MVPSLLPVTALSVAGALGATSAGTPRPRSGEIGNENADVGPPASGTAGTAAGTGEGAPGAADAEKPRGATSSPGATPRPDRLWNAN